MGGELPSVLELSMIAKAAGDLIMEVYRQGEVESWEKDDSSPVTLADRRADEYIVGALASAFGYPVISEESYDPEDPLSYERYFLVDPLDGTKEFLKKREFFTVNIAFVVSGRPTIGVIYAPLLDELYTGGPDGVLKNQKPLSLDHVSKATAKTAALSRSHRDQKLQEFVTQNQIASVHHVGSSYKFGMLCDGRADVYLRYGPTMEWDTAAGQVLCESLGFEILSIPDLRPLTYGKPSLLNPGFIVKPRGSEFVIP